MRAERGIFKRVGETLWGHLEGRTFTIDLKSQGSRSRRGQLKAVLDSVVIESTMPGKLLKLNHSVGHAVKKNATLVVLEAMKMEYALKAPFEGKIKGLFKKLGDTVVLGEKIAEVEMVKP